MGGFALHDVDKSFLRVLDERTLEELYKTGEIEWPTITVKEIQDRSKADIFSKGIVLLQTTWFVIQCISQFATKLAVTELGVVTLAFAVLNGVTYWLWWDKPSDVRCAVHVFLKSAEGSNAKVSEARRHRDTSIFVSTNPIQPTTKWDSFLPSFGCSLAGRDIIIQHGLILTILYTLLWAPIRLIFRPLSYMGNTEIPDNDATRVPTFYTPLEKKRVFEVAPSLWTKIGVITLFGVIHFIPWTFTLPTTAERWLWRVSTILITGGPLLPLLLGIMSYWVSNPILGGILNTSSNVVFIILIPVYIISRTILLIIPLTVLRSLPPTAFLELKWSEFCPHI